MEKAVFERYVEQVMRILETQRLFFVCGAPKSGTTWLQKALDAHPEIVCAGEGHFADRFAVGLSQLFSEYHKHQQVVATNVYEGHPYYRPAAKNDFDFLVVSFILNSFSRLKIDSGTSILGDKTPANVEHMNSLRRLLPDAKFVTIVRDGRDVLVSQFKHAARVNRATGVIQDMERFLLENTRIYAERWVRAVKSADEFGVKFPDALHVVRYEDLKSDFAVTFAGVLEFLGAEASGTVVAHCESAASFERLTNGRQPGQEDPNAFVRKGIVGDWRENLTRGHLEIFEEGAAEWLDRWSYPRELGDAGNGTLI